MTEDMIKKGNSKWIRILIIAVCAVLPRQSRSSELLLDEHFADGMSGWTGPGSKSGWVAAGEHMRVAAKEFRNSPRFAVGPFEYYRVSFRVRCDSAAMAACIRTNRSAVWNRLLSSQTAELVADDYTSLHPASDWRQELFFTRACANADSAYVRFHALSNDVDIDNVAVHTTSDQDILAWADSLYGALVTLNVSLPADRLDPLCSTIALLRSGKRVRIVLLGDSIMNDLANSPFDLLLERLYPDATIEVVAAVNGGTGMDKWNHPEKYPDKDINLDKAVIGQKPDLVMIGGISTPATSDGYEDIRQIIDKIRTGVQSAHNYRPDILLLTGAFGSSANPADPETGWTEQIDTAANDYRAVLYRIAAEKQTGFFDLRGVWGRYMLDAQNAGLDYELFFRDPVHAGTEGKQILARAIKAFFTVTPVSLIRSLRCVSENNPLYPSIFTILGRCVAQADVRSGRYGGHGILVTTGKYPAKKVLHIEGKPTPQLRNHADSNKKNINTPRK
jgi:hypothetical protein